MEHSQEPHGGAYAAAVRAEVLALTEDVRQAGLREAVWERACRAQAEGAALREERLRDERDAARAVVAALAERVAAQSELLTRRAELCV